MLNKLWEMVRHAETSGNELDEMKEKLKELEKTGSTRFYDREHWDFSELMEFLEEGLDKNNYVYGLEETEKGLFLEIVNYNRD